MQIAPPFGYREVVPFLKNHKVRLLAPAEVPPFARASNAVPISYTEFAPACRDYPIVFTSSDGKSGFSPVAVTGLSAGENLFSVEGHWVPGVYVPAYVVAEPRAAARRVREGPRAQPRDVQRALRLRPVRALLDAGDAQGGRREAGADDRHVPHRREEDRGPEQPPSSRTSRAKVSSGASTCTCSRSRTSGGCSIARRKRLKKCAAARRREFPAEARAAPAGSPAP
jgi:hypothetical protein